MGRSTDITLYTAATPNGIKVTILLAELDLEYELRDVKLTANEQKEPWFLAINPNGRIPAITDKRPDGSLQRVFETGAIMQYLVDKYDTEYKLSYPRDTPEYWEMTSWLMWQMGGLGPMRGQANHFKRYAPETIEYGINRYVNESRRLYRVMDDHLAASPSGYLVGDRCTIADLACWPWVIDAKWGGVDLSEFPSLKKWMLKLLERPGVEKGRHVPSRHGALDYEKMTEEELDQKAAASRAWIQSGMKDDAKK
ncbi:glutathione S-transferase [Stachybotrys elegans]|uniref:Glutathione S-transferase n=1 Tax=Stachybotrys elegans TaxID=80388 RepID=A0A8K0SNH6_9HYPO|nr:glutathione S-transferase [Stachybotrys elegans]